MFLHTWKNKKKGKCDAFSCSFDISRCENVLRLLILNFLLTRETSDFIAPGLRPPNSPDLNPIDYKIWDVMQQRAHETSVNNLNDLKQQLIEGPSL